MHHCHSRGRYFGLLLATWIRDLSAVYSKSTSPSWDSSDYSVSLKRICHDPWDMIG